MTSPGSYNSNVVLTADVGQYQQSMGSANDTTTTLLNTLAKLNTASDNLFKSAGRKLELFGAGGTATIGAAVVSLSQLDAQLTRVRASAALTGTNVPNIAAGLRTMSAQIPVSTRDLATLATTIQTLGVRGSSDVVKLTKTFAQLGASVGEDSTQLAQNLIQLTRSMGQAIDPQQMTRYASAVNEVTQQLGVSATSATQFAQAIQPLGKLLGLTETQLIGVAGSFSKAGADGFAAGNAFARIASMISTDVRTGNPQLKQFADIVGMTTSQFKALVQSKPDQALNALFNALNQRGPAALDVLSSLGLDAPRTMQAIQRVVQGGGLGEGITAAQRGAADPSRLARSAAAAFDDLQHNLRQFAQNIQNLVTGPFVWLERGVNRVVGVLNELLKVLIEIGNLPGIHQLIEAFGSIASAVAPMVAVAGLLLGMVGTLAKLGILWTTVFSRTGVSAVTGVRDALRGTARDMEGAGLIPRGAYGAGRLIGGGLYTVGVRPGAGGGEGVGFGERVAARGVQAVTMLGRTFYVTPIQNLGAGLRAAATGGLGGAAEQALYRPTAGGLWGGLFGPPTKTGEAAAKGLDSFTVGIEKATAATAANAGANAASAKTTGAKTGAEAADTKATSAQTAASERATVSLSEMAGAAARAAGAMVVQAGGAVAGAAGVGARVAGRGLMRAGAGLMGALGGPWGIGLTAAAIGLPLGMQLFSSLAGRNRPLSQAQIDAASGSFINNLNSFNTVTGQATQSLDDLKNAAGQAAVAVSPKGGPLTPFGPDEVAKAMDAAFQTKGYDPSARLSTDQKIAQLTQTIYTELGKPGAQPLSTAAQQNLRMQLERLTGDVPRAQQLYNTMQAATHNFTTASTDMRSVSRVYATIGQRYSQLASQGGGRGAQIGGSLLFDPLNVLARQQYNAPAGGAVATQTRAQMLAQLSGMLQNIPGVSPAQIQAMQAAGQQVDEHSFDYIKKDYFKKIATSLGFNAKVGDVTNMGDLVKNAFDANSVTATRIFGPNRGAGTNWNDPAAILRISQALQGTLGAGGPGGPQSPFAQAGLAQLNIRPGTGLAGAVLGTLGGSQNPQVLTQAIYGTAAALTAGGASAAQAQKALSDWAATADMSTDAAKQYAAAVQDVVNQMTDLQRSTMSVPQRMGDIAAQMATLNPNDPNFQKQFAALQQQGQQAYASGVQMAQQYLLQLDQFNIQRRRGAEDLQRTMTRDRTAFDLQETRARQDFNTQTARATEDFNLQQQRSGQDFQRQTLRSEQDYHKQRVRAQEDFNTQMLYGQQDYQRSRARAQRDFDYQEQQYVKQVAQTLDPWAQVQAQSVADATQVLANVTQQNQMYARAGQQLNALRRMGLSQNVIDVLGLSDPKNIQQLNRFYTDIAANPQLVQSFNKSIKGRLDWTQGLATNKSSTQWRDMEHQFNIAAQDAAQDFITANARAHREFDKQARRSQDDFQTMLDRNEADFRLQQERAEADFTKMLDRNAADFKKQTERSEHDFAVQMSNMQEDYKISIKRALEDINHFASDAYGTANQVLQRAWDKSSGDMKKFFAGIISQEQALIRAQQQAMRGGGGLPGAAPAGSASNPISTPGTMGINPQGQYGYYGAGGGFHPVTGVTGAERRGAPHIISPTALPVGTPQKNQNWAKAYIKAAYGWGDNEFAALVRLWNNESGWNQNAINPVGGDPATSAYGIPQSLPGNKMADFGADWRTNPITQMKWGLNYIKSRYGDPIGAVNFEFSHSPPWYAAGALFNKQQIIGIAERGPEAVFPLNERGAEFLLSLMKRANSEAFAALTGVSKASAVAATVINTHVDSSTNFNGAVTVQAQDPNAMAVALKNRARLAALTRPDMTSGVLP